MPCVLDHPQAAEHPPAAALVGRTRPVQFNAVLVTQLLLVAGSCLLVGVLPYLFTAEETEIVTYTAPKETPRKPPEATAAVPGKPGRLWGVIVPRESEVWYFKLTGPIDDVKQREPELRDFIQKVEFTNELPAWKLPEGWTQRAGNDIRFATIVVPADPEPMELTVIKLPRNGPLDKLLLDNVNRWRDQITLPSLKQDELAAQTERIPVAGIESTLVNLEGVLKPSSMTRPPFAR